MPAGSKITDDAQEFQFSLPFISPSGHEFSFYDTPDNQRLVIRHTSGSHMEFKADGSVFIKAVKDLHTHSSVASSQSAMAGGADNTTVRHDTDYTMEVAGRLRFKCDQLDFEIGSTGRIIAGTDLILSSNNMINKATESISLEGTKSIYVDTKEMRERVQSRQTETGTAGSAQTPGGLNVMRVHGNTIIDNQDPNGGITISSAGYLNLVAGAERVDIVGKYTTTPSTMALGTFTQRIFPSVGALDVSTSKGDYIFQSSAGAHYTYSMLTSGSSLSKTDGLSENVVLGNDTKTVLVGNKTETVTAGNRVRSVGLNETVTIGGIQKVTATKIFLN
jgi:hypothetical protein